MARRKIREYDSKRLLKEHLKRLAGIDLQICSAQVTEVTDFTELTDKEPWLSSNKLVLKPDMLLGKRGKSGLVALNLDLAQVAQFVKGRLGVEVMFVVLLHFVMNISIILPGSIKQSIRKVGPFEEW